MCNTEIGTATSKGTTIMRKAGQKPFVVRPGLHGNLSIESIEKHLFYTFSSDQIRAIKKLKKGEAFFFPRSTSPLFSIDRV